jgi:monofunctional biosynthetic peptidoglycan transglycosylase
VLKKKQGEKPKRRGYVRRILRFCFLAVVLAWCGAAAGLLALRWIDPLTTAVQAQRRIQALVHKTKYQKRYSFAPMERISPNLQHAVVAAEDARFYQHHGFDWKELQDAVEDKLEDGRTRGASTLTQQLIKNLYFGTSRSFIRKAAEATLVPVAEFGLGKRRILELYLNVVEWGPGVFGAEAAAQYHYHTSARRLTREQSARLAAVLPLPLRRRPDRMNGYSDKILGRMGQMGW